MNFHEFKRGKRDFRTQDSMCQECGQHVSHDNRHECECGAKWRNARKREKAEARS